MYKILLNETVLDTLPTREQVEDAIDAISSELTDIDSAIRYDETYEPPPTCTRRDLAIKTYELLKATRKPTSDSERPDLKFKYNYMSSLVAVDIATNEIIDSY